ncbi:MAG: hypothetical protein PHZ11_10695 [Desulfitobacteriaceae bacterium]|nr:hypothetical protein [Desulfitobacteriaceae bacterium]MDD4347322.1 hypothetical protein [Desulfitobacteriaceae bacterium]MDD4401290.1 hypothetical protein [Desulfitobacteriaceae bacterium]
MGPGAKLSNVPVEKRGVNNHQRQKGKIAELALGYGSSKKRKIPSHTHNHKGVVEGFVL